MTNDLTVKPAQPLTAQQGARYVSPFEKIATYDELCAAGEMFSRSQLVPDTFRGKPGDCAIALDLALRLNLNPLSLFPQLFVIHGRPSLSSQYKIAIVNRSGKFSCIQWEEGIDGDVEFSAYGKTRRSPNYYAIAEFTEKATGKTFKSTRVDIRVALANGWLTKDGSKWVTMPQQMCRYRSASWLINSVAPELVLGLFSADEVEDSDAGATFPAATVETAAPAQLAATDDEYDGPRFGDLINDLIVAANLDELKAAADAVAKAQGLTAQELNELRERYLSRKKELTETPLQPTSIIETENKTIQVLDVGKLAAQLVEKSSQPAPTQEETPTPEKSAAQTLETALHNAATDETIDAAVAKILDAVAAEEIDAATKDRLIIAARQKWAAMKQTLLTEEPTDQSALYARNLLESMEQSAENGDADLLYTQARCADLWFVHGSITSEQRGDLLSAFRRLTKNS